MEAVIRWMAVATISALAFGPAEAVGVSTAQQLVDAVNNNGTDGTEIVLAAGTYDLSTVSCSGAPGHMYAQKSVKLRGATGNPSDVIIKGDGANRILFFGKIGNEVRDLTFRDGDCSEYAYSTSSEPWETNGGGAICFRQAYDETLISNCVFIANKSKRGGAVGGCNTWAGGDLASGRLIDCIFTDNTANGSGGAVGYPLLVLRCAFTNNSCVGTWDHGGALVTARRVENSDFYRNGRTAGSQAGALKLAPDVTASAVVAGCTFTENETSTFGGALVAADNFVDVQVTNCTFTSNGKTSMSEGGAIRGVSNVVDCVFIGNRANKGGAAASSVLKDCVLCGNVAENYGGAAYLCGLDGCSVITNTARVYGGGAYQVDCPLLVTNCLFEANSFTADGSGGGVYGSTNVVDSVFRDNTARYGGGAGNSVLRTCVFVGNVATLQGGALFGSSSYDSLIATNTASYGGGAYDGSDSAPFAVLSGCRFVGNRATSSGGAVYQCRNATGCTFIDNEGNAGGAAYGSTLTGCFFRGNTSTDSSGGGAAHSSKLYFCTNTANRCSHGTGTDGTATELRESYAEDCTFTEVGESIHPVFVRSYFNRCHIDSMTNNCYYGAFNWEAGLTNCLVTRANVKNLFKVNCYDNHNSAIVSCTFADNGYLNFNYVAPENIKEQIDVVNTFFYGNRSGSGGGYDLDAYASYLVKSFRNCIFAAKEASYAPDSSTSLNYYGDAAFNPGFIGPEDDPENPYAIRLSSPARKRGGLVQDWMASANDIRGDGFPRLREGMVDIGCYQCWVAITGTAIILR